MILPAAVTMGRTVLFYPHVMRWKTLLVLPELTCPGETSMQRAGAATAIMSHDITKGTTLRSCIQFLFLKRKGGGLKHAKSSKMQVTLFVPE